MLHIRGPQKILFLNNKWWVGKTTITYNVGCMMASLWYKVLLVDWDPQANLTQLAIWKTQYQAQWFFDENTIYHIVEPIVQRLWDIDKSIEPISVGIWWEDTFEWRLHLIPGSMFFSDFDDVLSDWFREIGNGRTSWLTVTSAIDRYILTKTKKNEYDFVLIDVSPSLVWSINKMFFLMSDFFVTIAEPDIFSRMWIQHLWSKGNNRKSNRNDMIYRLRTSEDMKEAKVSHTIQGKTTFLWYIVNKFNVYNKSYISSHKSLIDELRPNIQSYLSEKFGRNWLLYLSHQETLGETQDYGKLPSVCQKIQKPIYLLSKQEYWSVEGTDNLMEKAISEIKSLTDNIIQRVSKWWE